MARRANQSAMFLEEIIAKIACATIILFYGDNVIIGSDTLKKNCLLNCDTIENVLTLNYRVRTAIVRATSDGFYLFCIYAKRSRIRFLFFIIIVVPCISHKRACMLQDGEKIARVQYGFGNDERVRMVNLSNFIAF